MYLLQKQCIFQRSRRCKSQCFSRLNHGGGGAGGLQENVYHIPVFTWQEFVTSSVCNKEVRIEVW